MVTNEDIAVELARQEQHLKSQAHRIDELEEYQKETRDLVRSVDKLAQTMQVMATEQDRQGKQLDVLEATRNDNRKYWFRTISTSITTGLIGYILAYIVGHIW